MKSNLVLFSSMFYDKRVSQFIKKKTGKSNKECKGYNIYPYEFKQLNMPFNINFLTKSNTPSDIQNKNIYLKKHIPDYIWGDEKSTNELFSSDVIFFHGGNTFEGLYLLKKYNLISNFREYVQNGGIIIGESAGSILMTPDISIAYFADSNNILLDDLSALNLVNIGIKPHADYYLSILNGFMAYARTCSYDKFYMLKENEFIIVDNGEIYPYNDVIELKEIPIQYYNILFKKSRFNCRLIKKDNYLKLKNDNNIKESRTMDTLSKSISTVTE